jgi:hypothetical protein
MSLLRSVGCVGAGLDNGLSPVVYCAEIITVPGKYLVPSCGLIKKVRQSQMALDAG